MRIVRIFTLVIFIFSFPIFAAELADDSFALRNCRFMAEASVRNLCFESVKGHRFDNRAVEICARGRDYSDDYGEFNTTCFREIRDRHFDGYSLRVCEHIADYETLMTCLRMIADRKPKVSARLEACARLNKDGLILTCMRQQTWYSLVPDPRFGSGPSTSADGSPSAR